MMTKRSAHIPTLMRIETTKSTTSFRRIDGNQKICGATTLQKICMYQIGGTGPVQRFRNANAS